MVVGRGGQEKGAQTCPALKGLKSPLSHTLLSWSRTPLSLSRPPSRLALHERARGGRLGKGEEEEGWGGGEGGGGGGGGDLPGWVVVKDDAGFGVAVQLDAASMVI
jgi:hypothetical protein